MKKNTLCYLVAGLLALYSAPPVDASSILYNRAPQSTLSQSTVFGQYGSGNAVDLNLSTFARTLEEEKAWWKADLGGVFEVDSVFILSSAQVKPVTWTFENTDLNTCYSWSLDPVKTYGFTYEYILPNYVYADVVTISLQDYGILQLNDCKIEVFGTTPAPEPATIVLFGLGALCLVLKRKYLKGRVLQHCRA